MRPADHPEFYRWPAPEGRSRESTIRLDARGRFWHDGALVEHAGLGAALHSWIGRHPDDGRYILSNGYDWTYFTVEDAPFRVDGVRFDGDLILLRLSDGSEELIAVETMHAGPDDALYVQVKGSAPGGPFEAKLTPHAQASLAPALVEMEGGGVGLRIGGRVVALTGPSETG